MQRLKEDRGVEVEEDIVMLKDGKLVGSLSESSAYFYRAYQSIQTK